MSGVRTVTQRFHWEDPEALSFYEEHGFVVVHGVLDSEERSRITPAWDALVSDAANAAEMAPDAFVQRFPQNRDLWSKSDAFRTLLFETSQAKVASRFLGTSGVRLFHDHAIAKPAGRSSTIPWHQDSAYWPLDRAGNSLWTPVDSVSASGGCLKVLDGSHRDGPGVPQDFLNPDGIERDEDPRLCKVPVAAGDTVVLHGLTWHGSDPNVDTVDRLAYLTLWVPSTARFEPSHAGWHPSAAHVDVEPGERLSGDWFPLFGSIADEDEGEFVAFDAPTPGQGLTMFKAGDAIRAQLRWLAGMPDAGMVSLLSPDSRAEVLDAAVTSSVLEPQERAALDAVLDDLALQERIRTNHVARDVYLTTVQRWWELVGHRIEQVRS